MTSRSHRMPFGAELQPDGAVRFRLWAPSARTVELALTNNGAQRFLPMNHQEKGWHALTTREAGAGSRYQYRIDGDLLVPDPASRSNPDDVHGPSRVIDAASYEWRDANWNGRPWHQAVVYELHVGTFTAEGTFAAVEKHLDQLANLGVTAIELMPLADFPGKRNWGYDGVLPYAPDASYGSPEELKHLIDAAHRRGLMVLLDVVYNHFGPDGNYLHVYAKPFFTKRHKTPWGEAIDFEGSHSRTVRDFFIHNALYWLEEYHLDGLRFDAVHAVYDDSALDIFTEISRKVRETLGRGRQIHLVLENYNNEAHRLTKAPATPGRFEAQWNDDIHHCFHVLLTGERDGYYQDFAQDPLRLLGRSLAEGFAYQGELSRYRRSRPRGEASAGLPPTCFISFLQNHDQIGNRALGERLTQLADPRALRAAVAIQLLAPAPPMLFMGEEWAAREPFPFFCDFNPDLAKAVKEGRLREFEHFDQFKNSAARAQIPDPGAPTTFTTATLNWNRITDLEHSRWLTYYRDLLTIRHREIIPRLPGAHSGHFNIDNDVLTVTWQLGDRSTLTLTANLKSEPRRFPNKPTGTPLFSTTAIDDGTASLPPWSVLWTLAPRHA